MLRETTWPPGRWNFRSGAEGGLYHNLVQVPATADKADLTVRVDIPEDGFTVTPLKQTDIPIELDLSQVRLLGRP